VGRLFFLSLLSVIPFVSLARPWIGVVCAYLFVILTPQAVWYWNFEDLRPVYWVLIPTLIGFLWRLLSGKYDLSIVKNRRVMFALVLWLAFVLSYFAGPYVDAQGPYRFSDPSVGLETLNKIFVLMLVGCVCVNSERSLKWLVIVMMISAIYLTYWANAQYLTGQIFGRLAGPVDQDGVGIYRDENNFAMLFVVAQPFLWNMGFMFKARWQRWALWLVIPFTWHAIFLTASRGGLVGVAATTLILGLRSKHRMLGLLLLPAFFFVYQWQAGDLMKSRAETISEYRTESSAATRIEAWQAALRMIGDHPVSGVGLASFGPAFPDYSDRHPREAHNTFLQITAESGVVAGAMYVLIFVTSIIALWKNGNVTRARTEADPANRSVQLLYLVNEATLVATCGLVVCSLFLSLQQFEVAYFLQVMVNAVLYLSSRSPAPVGDPNIAPAGGKGERKSRKLLRRA